VFTHTASVKSLAFSPDGRWLATGSDDATARLWDLSGLTTLNAGTALESDRQPSDIAIEPLELPGHAQQIASVAFSSDGRWLATGSRDQTIQLWDLSTMADTGPGSGKSAGGPIVIRGHEGPVTSLAFSPDGHWLASGGGGWEVTARLWDLSALPPPGMTEALTSAQVTQARLLRGHTAGVSTIAFSPDGGWLATGSLDDTVRLWDVSALMIQSGDLGSGATSEAQDPASEPVVLHGHSDDVTALAFSMDLEGRWLATISLDGTTRIWRMNQKELQALACRVAGRNLTHDEWAQYLPGREYIPTCDGLPVHPSVLDTERQES
jgi:WD40 repeat protein